MPADSYGIIVEGEYDSAAYTVLIHRLASRSVRVFPWPCYGKSNLIRKFPGYLEAFRHQINCDPVDTVIVITDADGQDPLELEAVLRSRVEGREYPFRLGVQFHAVQNALEAWLLADARAVSDVVSRRTGEIVNKTHDTPEALLDPKPVFRKLLEERRVAYTPAVASEIAELVDFEVLSFKCSRFRIFSKLID
jgi:hypothetical protein